jgi:lipopolysaccharide transport system ATP-binding protein
MKSTALSVREVGLSLPWRLKLNFKGMRERKRILSGINFDVAEGEIVALVGRNGCGKSTLFRVISGIYAPTEGAVVLPSGGRVSVMALSMGFMPPLTGRENVVLQGLISGMNLPAARLAASATASRLDGTLLAAEGRYDMPYHTYSAGMKAMIASSSALLRHAEVILVDEVFGVGDEVYRKDLAERLRAQADLGSAIVIVSHDTEVLRALCSRAVVLEQGRQASSSMSIDEALDFVGRKTHK